MQHLCLQVDVGIPLNCQEAGFPLCAMLGGLSHGAAHHSRIHLADFAQLPRREQCARTHTGTHPLRWVVEQYWLALDRRNVVIGLLLLASSYHIARAYEINICHRGDADCATPYTGVTTHYQFRVRIECPSLADCPATRESRMKLIQTRPENDLPANDTGNGCASGMHGEVDGIFRLPETAYTPFDGTAGGTVNPENCITPLNCQLRPDAATEGYREFGGAFGFNYTMGVTVSEDRSFSESKYVDVCYCNITCGEPTSWFKVGTFNLAPTLLVSAATNESNSTTEFSIEYVNQPGML
eukprot:2758804-Amphidinium_carterae.1